MSSRRDQIDELFKLSLSSGFQEEKYAGDFFEESTMIKIASGAGVEIPNPTYDKIINFVTELVTRDISDLTEEECPVTVQFQPSEQQGVGSNLIKQGSGVIQIMPVKDNEELVLEVPFLVVNGGLAPFDVIQINGQRAPYTRENLGKAINALIAQGQDDKQGIGDGYVRLEKLHNPSTSQGFLSDTLNVRHRGNVIPDVGGMFITADEKVIDGILKQAATLSPVDWSKVEAAAEALAAKNYQKFIKTASDEGEEISAMVKTASHNSDISRTLPWRNVRDVKDRTFIKFPTLEDGGVTMMAGLVLKNLTNVLSDDRAYVPDFYVVITADGRIKKLSKTDEGFICLESNKPLFKLHGCYIDGLRKADQFMVKEDDGSLSAPITIKSDSVRRVNTSNMQAGVFAENDVDVLSSVSLRELSLSCANREYGQCVVLPTEKPVCKMSKRKDIINYIADKNAAMAYKLEAIVPGSINIYAVSKGKRLIAVTGTIGKTFSNLDAVEAVLYGDTVKTAEEDFDGMMKIASIADTITVSKVGAKYNIKVKYQDKTERMFSSQEEVLEGLSESAAIGALIALNFSRSSATDLMVKVNHRNQVSCSLPANANPSKIFTSKKGKVKKAVADFKKAGGGRAVKDAVRSKMLEIAGDKIGKGLVGPAVAGLLTGTKLAKSQTLANILLDKSASLRDEAKTVSSVFEKRAVAEENATMRKCAKIMAMCSYFNDDCIKVMKDEDNYPHFDKLAQEIVNAKPILEDAIDDLLTEKIAYYKRGENHPMSVSFYGAAIGNMDNTFKIAKGIIGE